MLKPRLGGLTFGLKQKDVEGCVIGLPDGVGSSRLTPVNHFESVAVRLRSFMRESNQIGWQGGDDAVDNPITGRLFAQILREPPGLATDRGNWQRRLLQSDAFDGLLEFG